jgi:hypothetical protein
VRLHDKVVLPALQRPTPASQPRQPSVTLSRHTIRSRRDELPWIRVQSVTGLAHSVGSTTCSRAVKEGAW